MSEINAIATNNYLLAAQQEVSHDNSLSGNGTVDSPLGVVSEWENVTSEVSYNQSLILAGSFRIFYNRTLRMVSLVCDVQVKAGSVGTVFMTWTDRLKPADTLQFALGSNLYVGPDNLNQSVGAAQRWINGCWVWAVKGE